MPAKSTKEAVTTKKKATKSKSAKGRKKTRKKTLLIVESPSKARIIGRFLGSSYKVIASVGHVRDLPKSRLGVEIDNNFEPDYINIRGKGETIRELKKEAAAASKILLATDPDREGEAISWHLGHILGIDPESDCRITFHEINKKAVQEAIKHPRPIDMGLVDAQQARRILDRLVGYQISPLLWKKVRRGLSAGRVQSAALRIICDREKEIRAFVPEEFWNIEVEFGKNFTAKLEKTAGKKIAISSEAEAGKICAELRDGIFEVAEVKKGQKKIGPYAPFTTSTLQQDAAIKLSFQTKRTMRVAQELYEGVSLKGHGAQGLITYLRTDSVRVSAQAREMAKSFIESKYGERYCGNNLFSNRKKDIQDAHEAIRPVDVNIMPSEIRDSLTSDQLKLYNLIWTRFVASQMSVSINDTKSVKIKNGKYQFGASGSMMVFDGWRKVYNTLTKGVDKKIPEVTRGEKLEFEKIIPEQKFTTPPPRYTEASLVKEMEEKNIGRPSTYASIISTLTTRRYVKREKKNIIPTDLGFDVVNILSEYFGDIVNVEFTGEMEDNLDKVELRDEGWKDVVSEFYEGFAKELEVADREVAKIEQKVELTDEVCDKCGRPMAIKEGRFGKFLACTGYPECKNTKPIVRKIGVTCPNCGKDLVERKSKRGRIFYGCIGYPDCKTSFWDKPTGEKCPECGSLLLEIKGKKKKIKCSNENCDYVRDVNEHDKEA